MAIWSELRRRNVVRVGVAYLLASWVLLQIMDVVAPALTLPDWTPRLLLVVLAIGLVPVLVFSWAFELTPEGIKRESEVARSESITRFTARRLNLVILAFLAVAIGMQFVLWQRSPAAPVADDATAAAPGGESIAVLPFVNMSSDEEQDYFSDGITEEILNSLASVRELKVAGRTSSFAFKGQNEDLRRIGEALGVSHILEGSVRKAGDKVRITAQLIQADDGFHVWSETYDRKLTDVFAIQEDIANEILRQLKIHLLTDSMQVNDVMATSPEVYDLYLKAKQRIYTRTRAEIEAAIDELDRAIQLDPDYAPAYAQRGIATMIMSEQQYGTIPHDEAMRRGRRFVDKSIELDENLAEGWAGLGLYYGNIPGGENEAIDPLMKALSINPNLIDASNWLQIALRGVGDFQGALKILVETAERDPLYRPAFANALMGFNNFGEPERAEALLERIAAIDPANPDLLSARAINFMYSGRTGEGLKEIEKRAALGPMSGVERIFLSVGLLGTLQFERAAEEGSLFFRPEALFALGRRDEAFDMAYEYATSGYPETLFRLLNRDGRSQDVVDYLEERWPGLSEFADENRGDENGYAIMTEVALAYSRTGNAGRFEEAMQFVQWHMDKIEQQGIDNIVLAFNRAVEYALLDDRDRAIASLQDAAKRGWAPEGPLAEVAPALAAVADDARFAEVQAEMLAITNRDRAIVGLAPVGPDFKVAAPGAASSL